jgi:cytochrome c553
MIRRNLPSGRAQLAVNEGMMRGKGVLRKLCGLAAALAIAGAVNAIPFPRAFGQQPAKPGDDLRPLVMTMQDVSDGKDLAASSCASCHGADGISVKEGAPNLAGQRPSYLYRELKAYQLGERPPSDEGHSARLLKFLSDDALAKLAAYYASLDPALPPNGPAPMFESASALGKTAAQPCAKCHGDTGVSHKEGVPSLIGLNPKFLFESMKAYKNGDRPVDEKNADMKKALDALDDQDLQHVALYYAVQSESLTRAQTPSPGGPPASKAALAACVKCHDENGIGNGAVNPNLAGQDATYMLNALLAYKNGVRDDETMAAKVKKLSDDELKAFAVYYAGLDPKPLGIPRPLSPDEWAEKCDRCHGVDGSSVRPEVPALAGQRANYLEKVLKAYRSGARTSPEMVAMTSILTDDEIKGLAAHYAYKKGRSVVFVPVPVK